jgi:hypothetical protein
VKLVQLARIVDLHFLSSNNERDLISEFYHANVCILNAELMGGTKLSLYVSKMTIIVKKT